MQNLILSLLKESNEKDYFESYLAYMISPIITGIKPCSLLNINDNKKNFLKSWIKYRNEFLSSLNLDSMIIKEESKKETVLIYNKATLSSLLKCTNIQIFLKDYGYNNLDDINDTLLHLNKRLNNLNFPHEIGVFLGIPIHDVVGFINCGNTPCLLCGYWKVYSNTETAKELFRKYDLSKELVANYIIEKKNLSHLCNNLPSIFSV